MTLLWCFSSTCIIIILINTELISSSFNENNLVVFMLITIWYYLIATGLFYLLRKLIKIDSFFLIFIAITVTVLAVDFLILKSIGLLNTENWFNSLLFILMESALLWVSYALTYKVFSKYRFK